MIQFIGVDTQCLHDGRQGGDVFSQVDANTSAVICTVCGEFGTFLSQSSGTVMQTIYVSIKFETSILVNL